MDKAKEGAVVSTLKVAALKAIGNSMCLVMS